MRAGVVEVPILKQGNYLIASIQSALSDSDLAQLRDRLVIQVGRLRSRGVIIDLTALDIMDSFATRTLRDTAHMIRLRGAETVIVGIEPRALDRPPVESGAAERTLPGETATGDRFVIRRRPGGVLFAVIDGLGHGPDASRAAEIAVNVLNGSATTDVVGLVRECHDRLHDSRGVVMTMVAINTGARRASWIGIGNVQGMLAHFDSGQNSGERSFAVLRAGVVGQRLPILQPTVLTVGRGDTFVLATDGVALDFMKERSLGQPPQQVAERIMEKYGLETDDALVLVVRYLGEDDEQSTGRSGR